MMVFMVNWFLSPLSVVFFDTLSCSKIIRKEPIWKLSGVPRSVRRGLNIIEKIYTDRRDLRCRHCLL